MTDLICCCLFPFRSFSVLDSSNHCLFHDHHSFAVGYQYPWAMLALAVLMGSDPVPDLIGIFAGHLFYFLIDVGPNKYADVSWCRCTVVSCYWWRHARLFRVANMCSVFVCG